ncbi:RNA polymerase sigma factor [Chitinophaga sp. 22321]|uniref:RNA polymerase sigma factor n=1 Tax=Chitinophaga TaxID=79328 RepID=UPI0024B10274|nr:sigma-70 family RNA polymerase sigma factor [Chitinophaga hostae]
MYRLLYPGLFSLCRKYFVCEQDIVTVVNNGMLNIFRNLGMYDVKKGDIFPWAYAIVKHAALTYLRNKLNAKEKEHLNMDDCMDLPSPCNPIVSLASKDIYLYLSVLPAMTRTVCIMFYLDGFLVREIAAHFQISEGTVKWHLSEGRSILKKAMKKKDAY